MCYHLTTSQSPEMSPTESQKGVLAFLSESPKGQARGPEKQDYVCPVSKSYMIALYLLPGALVWGRIDPCSDWEMCYVTLKR